LQHGATQPSAVGRAGRARKERWQARAGAAAPGRAEPPDPLPLPGVGRQRRRVAGTRRGTNSCLQTGLDSDNAGRDDKGTKDGALGEHTFLPRQAASCPPPGAARGESSRTVGDARLVQLTRVSRRYRSLHKPEPMQDKIPPPLDKICLCLEILFWQGGCCTRGRAGVSLNRHFLKSSSTKATCPNPRSRGSSETRPHQRAQAPLAAAQPGAPCDPAARAPQDQESQPGPPRQCPAPIHPNPVGTAAPWSRSLQPSGARQPRPPASRALHLEAEHTGDTRMPLCPAVQIRLQSSFTAQHLQSCLSASAGCRSAPRQSLQHSLAAIPGQSSWRYWEEQGSTSKLAQPSAGTQPRASGDGQRSHREGSRGASAAEGRGGRLTPACWRHRGLAQGSGGCPALPPLPQGWLSPKARGFQLCPALDVWREGRKTLPVKGPLHSRSPGGRAGDGPKPSSTPLTQRLASRSPTAVSHGEGACLPRGLPLIHLGPGASFSPRHSWGYRPAWPAPAAPSPSSGGHPPCPQQGRSRRSRGHPRTGTAGEKGGHPQPPGELS